MSNVNVNLTLENIRTITVMFLDIFIMWLILYYTIRIIRSSSKTVQIFKGLLLIIIIDALAKLLGMKTVAYLTDIFVNWGFLAMIIIFQPELRALLERLGKTNVFSRITTLSGNEKEHLVDQIVTATMLLSRDQTGALISIEQSHSLDDFIATGTRLNSDVTAELLTSIFVTSTPLHDGAVIIQGDKIACASAYFPPTNLELPSRYGARHRAAIGISEITDAVTIIVSEETGAISVTENGQIITVNQKQLRNYLLRVICGEETEVHSTGRKTIEAPREVIIDDTQNIEDKKNKKDHGMTSVLSVLAIKKQEAKEHEKIEVEEVVPAVSLEDEKMKELEEGVSEIKLPHKKDRPTPSYPKNSSTERFEAEKRKEKIKATEEKQQEPEEEQKIEAEEVIQPEVSEPNEQEQVVEQEQENVDLAEQQRLEKEEQERIALEEQKRIEKEEQERLALEEQKRKEKEEQERKFAEERNQRAAQRMRERYEAEYKAKAEKAAELSRQEEEAEKTAESTDDSHQFDTTKIDLSQMMGLDNDLDKTFDLIDQIDVSGHHSSSDNKEGGEQ